MPIELIKLVLGSDNIRQAVIVVIAIGFYSFGQKLITGWINNRHKQTDYKHDRVSDLETRLTDIQKEQTVILLARLKDVETDAEEERTRYELKETELKAEVEHWRALSQEWYSKNMLAFSVASQQTDVIKDLERQLESQARQIKALERKVNNV